MEPEPTQATLTLTIDGEPVDIGEFLRGIVREEVSAAMKAAGEVLSEVIIGKTPITELPDVRGMTCDQAVAVTGKPCKGICTHDFSDPHVPSVIADPDCFR